MDATLGIVESAPPTFWIEVAVFIVLVALSGLFSGSEAAFLTLNRVRRRQLALEDRPGSRKLERLMSHPQRFLITILIVNNLVNIGAASLATRLAIQLFGEGGVAVATGVTTFLVLTFGEITPKAYATLNNERLALRVSGLVLALQRVLFPVVRVYEVFTMWLLRRFGAEDESAAARQFGSEEELLTLITVGAEEGIIEESEEAMLHSVIELGDTLVREIMTPRTDVVAISTDSTLESVRPYVVESGFSRIPVYERSVDNIVGVLYVRDLLTRVVTGEGTTLVRALMREPYFVPEAKRVAELLSEMRDKRVHLAVVLDEFGGTAGIVTMEDVLEEIVGEIFDEYDLRQDPIRLIDDRTAVVDARTSVADVNDALGTDVPKEGPYDTLGGFISHELGHLGREGEAVHVEGASFLVDRATHRRILRVRVTLPEATRPAGEGAGPREGAEAGATG